MSHYDEKYFEWQRKVGVVGGVLNKFKFENHVKPADTVLDFGCGGGYLLGNICCSKKIGVECNINAHDECRKNGVEIHQELDEIDNDSVDVIISNHAMEHVPEPFKVLKQMKQKLKKGGTVVIVTPYTQAHEEQGKEWKPGDHNQHLVSWCPMELGNLATLAGFKVEECKSFQHTWPDDYMSTYKDKNIHNRCIKHAKKLGIYQVKLVGTK